jgi:hypothetical protein
LETGERLCSRTDPEEILLRPAENVLKVDPASFSTADLDCIAQPRLLARSEANELRTNLLEQALLDEVVNEASFDMPRLAERRIAAQRLLHYLQDLDLAVVVREDLALIEAVRKWEARPGIKRLAALTEDLDRVGPLHRRCDVKRALSARR